MWHNNFEIVPYESIEEACKESDVIITLTTADAVLVEEPWCKPGCLVMPMAHRGEITAEDFDAELTEVAAGIKAGRDNDSQRIICQLVGMGRLDLTVVTLAYERITASDEDIVMIDIDGIKMRKDVRF